MIHHHLKLLLPLLLLVLLPLFAPTYADRGIDGRHSYSLTTFDPNGKLGQVERAMEAAQQHGTPIVAIALEDSVLLAAPQALPSALAIDDGTPRFALVTPEIVVAHSGLAADGRILTAAAQRLAVEHEYTFDEHVDIAIFLEEMALLLQKYTSMAGARPFGASLIVAFVPETDLCLKPEPQLYRIDPSGNVATLERVALVHGNLEHGTQLREQLQHIITKQALQQTQALEDNRSQLVVALQQALQQMANNRGNRGEYQGLPILTASLRRAVAPQDGSVFQTTRHEPDDG